MAEQYFSSENNHLGKTSSDHRNPDFRSGTDDIGGSFFLLCPLGMTLESPSAYALLCLRKSVSAFCPGENAVTAAMKMDLPAAAPLPLDGL